MANAPKFAYYLTEKQARTLIDAISMQARFFTKHMKTSDINYLRKVEAVMILQHNRDKSLRQSAYGKLTFGKPLTDYEIKNRIAESVRKSTGFNAKTGEIFYEQEE